jgi:dephospho-CoA kinase
MITIGLTGSIGMGKTETTKIFANLGIPVFDSDAAVHSLLGPGGAAVDAVDGAFPGVKKDDKIDRELLAKKVFGDDKALENLEKILHPLVSEKRKEFIKKQIADIVLSDIPLLFEKGYEDEFDYIIVVSAPHDIQKKRVLSRPNMTEDRLNDILARQVPDNVKRKKADFIIQTDRGLDYARHQVEDVLKQIWKENNA